MEQGGDPVATVRQMLDIGGMVLQHGANSTLVEAVIGEIRRESVTQKSLHAISERAPAKGLRFETLLQPILEAAFAGHGDVVEATGGTPGIDGASKKGDFVVTLNTETIGGRNRRVVVEAKDRPSQRLAGKDGALTYLADAMVNRSAAAGVMVCAQRVPALGHHRHRVFSGNRILVLLDKEDPDPLAVEVACQLARGVAGRAVGDEDLGTSRPYVTERVERLREVIERASEIRAGVVHARNGLQRIDAAYRDFQEDALALVYELEDRLAE
jgi:hypothetical protein